MEYGFKTYYIMKRGLLILLMAAVGCSDNNTPQGPVTPPDGTVFSESFVQTYVVPSAMSVTLPKENSMLLTFEGREVGSMAQNDREAYTRLCEKYNDLAFNRMIVPNSTRALAENISAVDIVCDKAIDEDHPAGASLRDAVKVYAASFNEFIESGYVKFFPFPHDYQGLGFYNGEGASPVCKLLSDLAANDLRLAEPRLYLRFVNGLPAGEYVFTVTVTTETGKLSENISVTI